MADEERTHTGEPTRAIGDPGACSFAREQLDAARKDPRLSRSDGQAVIADFNDALEEAERSRLLSIWGLHELARSVTREAEQLGVNADDPDLPDGSRRRLQAAWERAAWAQAELDNDTPHLNASALVSFNSALDAMVEQLVAAWREFTVEHLHLQVLGKAKEEVPEAFAAVAPDVLDAVQAVVRAMIDEELVPSARKPRGDGAQRYEKPLRRIGWGAPPDRAIPQDLDQALTELGAVRDVLVHRAGRVDADALRRASTLRFSDGEFVRITTQDYRTYSAAIRCYGAEVAFRPMRNWPEVTADDVPNLARWRDYVRLGA